MKKRLIFGLLLCFFNNISSMENQEVKSCLNILELPNEMRNLLIERVIEYEINKWTNISDFDKHSLKEQIDTICLISKNFNVLSEEELINFVTRLKEARLIKLKQILKEQGTEGYTALMSAIANNHREIVELLIASSDLYIQDNNGYSALMLSANNGNAAIMELISSKINFE